MIKKVLYISIFCFVVALSGLIAQKVFFNRDGTGEQKSEEQLENAQQQVIDEVEQNKNEQNAKWSEKIKVILELGVEGATIAGNSSQVLYYQNQRFLLADFNGDKKNSIGAYPFVQVDGIEWNAKKQKALVVDRGDYLIYDLNDNSVKELDKNIDIAIWDSRGEKIVYKYYNPQTKTRGLATMDPFEEENRQGIIDELPFKIVDILAIPKTSQVCVFPYPDFGIKEPFNCYDTRNNEEVFTFVGDYGADYKWSPDGKRLLVSYLQPGTNNKLILGVTNEQGSEFNGLGFSTTVKKCVWSDDNEHVYCAMLSLPDEAAGLAQLPNDWQSEKYHSVDTFWKINVNDRKKERLIEAEEIPVNIDADNLFVDPDERYLFFTDRNTGNLYRLAL